MSLLFSQLNYQKYQWKSRCCNYYYCEKQCLIKAYEFGPVFEMVLEVWSSFSHHILLAERVLKCRSFDNHMRSKLLKCDEDTHTSSQVHDTRAYRGNEVRQRSGQEAIWRHHVRIWGLQEANVLDWRKFFWTLFGLTV